MTTPEDKRRNPTIAAGTAPGKPTGASPLDTERGQAHFLRLMTEQLTGWDNPRAMLERALREDQFLLLAQKILSLKSGAPEPVCYEVLLRLKQEEDNLLPPGGFLDVAESLGMMEKIDYWVVKTVLAWSAARLKKNPAAQLPMMCVNISLAALISPSFANAVREELRRSGVPPRSLCFEINEPDLIEHHKSAQAFIAALKPLGCRFTVDSFGSIKVAFTHLKDLSIDFVKIDGIIIQNILNDPLGFATAKAINIVCQEIGIRTIAEFVETKETLGKLREIGVDYVQGFGIARPAPISTLD